MKKHLILFLLFLGLIACTKDDVSNSEVIGNASAIKNGIEWFSDVNFFHKNIPFNIGFDINLIKYNNKGLARESLSFYRLQNTFEPQTIHLTNSQVENDSLGVFYTTLIDDGDVLGDIYGLDTTATNNFIQITNYNSFKSEIEGIFNVSLILTRDSNDPGTPAEKLVFSNGEFKAKVQREWFE